MMIRANYILGTQDNFSGVQHLLNPSCYLLTLI